VVALCGRHANGLDERWCVCDAERTECRCDQDEDASHATGCPREFPRARRVATDHLMHPLMGEAKLLRNFAKWHAAAVEVKDSLVVRSPTRLRCV